MELLKAKGWEYEDLIAKQLDPEGYDAKQEVAKLREELSNIRKEQEEKVGEVM